MFKDEKIGTALRRKRTRTLIQLGGLIEKSGLMETVNIETGLDLQKDDEIKESVYELYGALLHLNETLQDPKNSKTFFIQKGKSHFQK